MKKRKQLQDLLHNALLSTHFENSSLFAIFNETAPGPGRYPFIGDYVVVFCL